VRHGAGSETSKEIWSKILDADSLSVTAVARRTASRDCVCIRKSPGRVCQNADFHTGLFHVDSAGRFWIARALRVRAVR
jgi:hypothetical protein